MGLWKFVLLSNNSWINSLNEETVLYALKWVDVSWHLKEQ